MLHRFMARRNFWRDGKTHRVIGGLLREAAARYARASEGATSSVMAMIMVLSLPIVAGSADALRWSVAYTHLASAAAAACDRMILTSRNHLHTFRDEDREKMALSAFDLEVFYRYPEATRSVELGVSERATAHPIGRVFAALDLETRILGIFGIDELPITIDSFCEGYPPFPILGDYLSNNDFGAFNPRVHETSGGWGATDSQGLLEVYFVKNITQFGWYATKTDAACGVEFGPSWNLHDQGNNPPPSGHTWVVQFRGCGLNWVMRQVELHPGYYEVYFETQSAGGLFSTNRTLLAINNINHPDAFRPYRGGWRTIDDFGGGIKIWGLRAGWFTRRILLKVNSYEVVMMAFLPQWSWLTWVQSQGSAISHFRIRYLGTDFDESTPGITSFKTIN